MTVEDLIDELAAFPPDMEVRVSNSAAEYMAGFLYRATPRTSRVFEPFAWMEENGYERAGERDGIVYFEKRRRRLTVAELIKVLAAFPPGMEVRVSNSAGEYRPIVPRRVTVFSEHQYGGSGERMPGEAYVLLDDGTTLP